jgi:2-polyprenyl-6-methoxyphenol hydroxylase-like FAD-dependent oxidoreductase
MNVMAHNGTSAIVIGASMAGLLTARALSTHLEHVTILERDTLPDSGLPRAGVPQSNHLHILLLSGQRTLEHFFPTIVADMEQAGAQRVHWGVDNHYLGIGGWSPYMESPYHNYAMSRAGLEHVVRQQVLQCPNITLRPHLEVMGLQTTADQSRVTGVTVRERGTQATETLTADLVVDASGRRSQAPQWLQAIGYPAPDVIVIDAHCGYASRVYERLPGEEPLMIALATRPGEDIYHAGGILAISETEYIVTLIGANEVYPPTDEAGFLDFTRHLADPILYEMLKDRKPLSRISGYRSLENRMRRYDKLPRQPDGFLVVGDAACALNPIYGQGMSAACLEARLLESLVAEPGAVRRIGWARETQRAVMQVIRGAWTMATSEDLRYPTVSGQPTLMSRISNVYFDWYMRALPYDTLLLRNFFEAMCLLIPPEALMRPDRLARVVWHNLVSRRGTSRPSRPLWGQPHMIPTPN